MADLRVPEMGESIVEATIGKWLKREGEAVAPGEPIMELETDKVNMEVSSERAGVLEKILKKTGDTVAVGEVIGVVAEGVGAKVASGAPQQAQATPASVSTADHVRATSVARNIAAEQNVDLSRVKGTGPGGRITREDVESQAKPAAPAPAAASAPATAAPAQARPAAPAPAPVQRPVVQPGDRSEERIKLSRRKLTIAKRLSEVNQTAVMTTTFNEIDMSATIDMRKRLRENFKARQGVDLGFMSFFVKASVGALRAYPKLNSELQGEELVMKRYFDIGIAIGSDEGLVVPVLRDADKMTFADIEASINNLAERTKQRKLTLEELQGGTFTITNGGVYGSLFSTPILNPPQVAILGMHGFKDRPVAVAGQVVIRPVMIVAMTYDHRVVDGSDAVKALVRIKELIEDPGKLLVDA